MRTMPTDRRFIVEFLRPTWWAVGAAAVFAGLGAGLHACWRTAMPTSSRSLSADHPLADALARATEVIRLPSPVLEPAEVVQAQLAGLAAAGSDGLGVLQCYVFASPANRSRTGPLERFAQMVRGESFRHFLNPKATLVGTPVIEGDAAYAMVTLVDQESNVQAYVWVLRRQDAAEFAGCWMTEGVRPVGAGVPAPSGESGLRDLERPGETPIPPENLHPNQPSQPYTT